VSGGGANQLLYEDGSQNLAASANLTYSGGVLANAGGHAKVTGAGYKLIAELTAGSSTSFAALWAGTTVALFQYPQSICFGIQAASGQADGGGNQYSQFSYGPTRNTYFGDLTAGAADPGNQVTILTSSSSKFPLAVRGNVSQSAPLIVLQQPSSTVAQRGAGYLDATLATATDASWKGRLVGYAGDFTSTNAGRREGWRVESDGTQPLLGFYGATAVAKAASPGTATGTDAAVINALITALRNLGLIT
jgi:hypothetical protein